jgi:peptidyl-prolyl cis-trans isomerase SurA
MSTTLRFPRRFKTLLAAVMLAGAAASSVSLMAPTAAYAQAVRATVNGIQITDAQVQQRARLLQVEGNNGGSNAALQQLITEALQMSEAERVGITVTNGEIDSAYIDVARAVNMSKERLDQFLGEAGTTPATLRARLQASIAWSGVVQTVILPRVQVSELQLDQQAAAQVSAWQTFDYILQEVIFLTPGGANASGRTGQANNYRAAFQGCDSSVQLSLNYTDAAVIDVGRRHATQLPEALAQELAGMNVGGITRPRVTERGVSMLAICEKAQANDLTFIREELRREAGQGETQQQADAYLEELRRNGRIVMN